MEQYRGTTILSVRRNGKVVIGGDGQVSLGNTIMKGNARKVRRLYNDKVIAGFAGGTADAFTLFERFEAKLEQHQGNLTKAAVELAKDWRTDRILRKLEALLAVADAEASLIITGNGDVLEPELGIAAIGSGGAAGMASHLGRGDDALRYLQTLLSRFIEANTLYRETGPVLETPLLAAGAIQEMMVQSWGGVIRVFPAVPRDWQDVAFHQFRTEGAFLVSAVRRTTATMWIQVTSLAGEPCRLKTDLKPPYKIRADRAFSPRTLAGGIVELDLRKGETVTLYAEDIALTFPDRKSTRLNSSHITRSRMPSSA